MVSSHKIITSFLLKHELQVSKASGHLKLTLLSEHFRAIWEHFSAFLSKWLFSTDVFLVILLNLIIRKLFESEQ